MKHRERVDTLLVKKGIANSRAKAQSIIMSGAVYVDGVRVDKAGTVVESDSSIEVKSSVPKYVSRGGIKLEAALLGFNVETAGKVAIDIGASTGGFTHCLLQHGARIVYAVDVGHGQLDWKLRQDPKVVVLERINARYLKPEIIGELADIVTIDVSFISLTKIIPTVTLLLKPGGTLVALIKPQFEVGKGEVGRGGIVKDESKHNKVIDKNTIFLKELGFKILGVIVSPILGADGNKEFFMAGIYEG